MQIGKKPNQSQFKPAVDSAIMNPLLHNVSHLKLTRWPLLLAKIAKFQSTSTVKCQSQSIGQYTDTFIPRMSEMEVMRGTGGSTG